MLRARLATLNAVSLLFLAFSIAVATSGGTTSTPTANAAVSWPVSTLLVSELQTGGASASDEFVEIANVGPFGVDLLGLEVVYVTSSGGTVTRKAAWLESRELAPGQHLLIANASGVLAPIADATYSGGFAATGGALALRAIGGAPIDSVGWGDATSSFVEGAAAPAPPPGSSLERRPGGIDGNTRDTNDNAADLVVQASPNPQNLVAPPVPNPGATPTPTSPPSPSATPTGAPTVAPTATPSPTASATPTPSPTPSAAPTGTPATAPTGTPNPTGTPTPSLLPTPAPTPTPTPTPIATPAPTPTPSPSPTPAITATPTAAPTPTGVPSPDPAVVSIAAARGLADGSIATVEGTLTSGLGALEDGRVGFIEDSTGGTAVYLAELPSSPWPAGTIVRIRGELDDRFAARTLRVALADVLVLGSGPLPTALDRATGSMDESVEGRLVTITGLTVGSPTTMADGTGLLVDDGSGSVRVIVASAALEGFSVPSGALVTAAGPVGQRDSSGTGTAGYRVHATEPSSFSILSLPIPAPTPTPPPPPTPTPTPAPSSTPAPSAGPSPTSSPSPSPGPSAAPLDIAAARARPVGTRLRVTGVVVAERGRVGLPPVFVIADSAAGLPVKIAEGMSVPPRGTRVVVEGTLADPFGQLELRLVSGGLTVLGVATMPDPAPIAGAGLGESTEGRLVTLEASATKKATRSSSGDVALEVRDAAGTTFRVMADASSGLGTADLATGATYRFSGIVGQRASRKGALDGYRLWLRDRDDIEVIASAEVPGGSQLPGSPAPSAAAAVAISAAVRSEGQVVSVDGVVTAGSGLLDSAGRRIVLADASGAIEVLLPSGTTARAGDRLLVSGEVGRAWGAPRIAATDVRPGSAGGVLPIVLDGAPGPAHEWRLVRVSGLVTDVRRLGAAWRAELRVSGEGVVISGLAGARIASTALVEGRQATVVGIVRRPYPSATDRRYQVLPRGPSDVALGPAGAGSNKGNEGSEGNEGRRANGHGGAGEAGAPGVAEMLPLDVDLATLEEHLAVLVRVGGLVVEPTPDGFTLDDATSIGRVVLRGEAAAYLGLLEPGDAVNAIGRVSRVDGEPVVLVEDPAGLVRVGDLGQAEPIVAPMPTPGATRPGSAGGPTFAGATVRDGFEIGLPVGLGGLLALSLLSLVLTLARRRRLAIRVASAARTRLAGLSNGKRSA